MAHYEPPHQDLRCLQSQLFSSLVVKDLNISKVSHLSVGISFCVLNNMKSILSSFIQNTTFEIEKAVLISKSCF